MARIVPICRPLKEELRDPAFASTYHAELQRLRIAHQIATARRAKGLTHAELARRMGTMQPTVARLESGTYYNCTMATLAKAARALQRHLRIEFGPSRGAFAVPKRRYAAKPARRGAKRRK